MVSIIFKTQCNLRAPNHSVVTKWSLLELSSFNAVDLDPDWNETVDIALIGFRGHLNKIKVRVVLMEVAPTPPPPPPPSLCLKSTGS